MYKSFLFILFASVTVFSAENLMPNPELALDLRSGRPKQWSASPNSEATRIQLSEGKHALQLSTSRDGERSFWQIHIPAITVNQGYRLIFRVKGDAGAKGRVYIECNKPWKTLGNQPFICDGTEQRFSFNFSFAMLENAPYLVLRLDTPGKIAYYDFHLEKYTPPLVHDADFSSINDVWRTGNDAKLERISLPNEKSGIKITSSSKKNPYAIQFGIPVAAKIPYIFRVRVKGTPGTSANAYMECSEPWKTCSSEVVSCTGDWQLLTVKVNFPKLGKLPYLVLRLIGDSGEVIFSEPELVTEAGVFVNGDFEAGTAGWNILHGAVVDSAGSHQKILELKNYSGIASAIQTQIAVKAGQLYRLSYSVRGGANKLYTDSQGATWFRVAPRMDGNILGDGERWQDSFQNWFRKFVIFRPEADGMIDIVCELKDPGLVQFDDIVIEPIKAVSQPLEIVLELPHAFRESALLGDPINITGSVETTLSGVARYELDFNEKKYQVDAKSPQFSLSTPKKEGVYPMTLAAFDSAEKLLKKIKIDFSVRSPAEREITFRNDRVMLIDGHAFFPIGVWSIGGNKSFADKMKLVAELGFNCARIDADDLDDAAEQGLMAFVHVPETLPQFSSKAEFERWDVAYRGEMSKIMNHPSLIGYINSDEPAWRGIAVQPLVDAYRYIRSIDPCRPIFLNEAPRGKIEDLRPYAAASDVYGVDIYPVPGPNSHSDLDDKMMTSVGKYTDISRKVVRDSKPVWMTLQAFSWGALTNRPPFVYPTPDENRFMAYNAIAHGATGLFYWGVNRGKEENWDFFRVLGVTIRELRAVSGFLVGETIKNKVSADHPEIRILHKRAENKNCYILLNESDKNLETKISGNLPATLFVLNENRSVSTDNGLFSERFAPYSVRVYTDSKTFPAPVVQPKTRRLFEKAFKSSESFRHANWIWFPGKHNTPGSVAFFKHEFIIPDGLESAEISIAADDSFRGFVNSTEIMRGSGYSKAFTRDIAKALKPGKNVLLIQVQDAGMAPCGIIFALKLQEKDGKISTIFSNSSIQTSEDGKTDWRNAEIIGKFGCQPWGYHIRAVPFIESGAAAAAAAVVMP